MAKWSWISHICRLFEALAINTNAWDYCSKLSPEPVWDYDLSGTSWWSPPWPYCVRHMWNGHGHAFVSWVALVTLYADNDMRQKLCIGSCAAVQNAFLVGVTKTITIASRDKSKIKDRQKEIKNKDRKEQSTLPKAKEERKAECGGEKENLLSPLLFLSRITTGGSFLGELPSLLPVPMGKCCHFLSHHSKSRGKLSSWSIKTIFAKAWMKKYTGQTPRNTQALSLMAASPYFSKSAQDPLTSRAMLKWQLHAEIRAASL